MNSIRSTPIFSFRLAGRASGHHRSRHRGGGEAPRRRSVPDRIQRDPRRSLTAERGLTPTRAADAAVRVAGDDGLPLALEFSFQNHQGRVGSRSEGVASPSRLRREASRSASLAMSMFFSSNSLFENSRHQPSPPPGHPYQQPLVGGREGQRAGTDAKNARTRIFEQTLKPRRCGGRSGCGRRGWG